jgi:hypothetical protein
MRLVICFIYIFLVGVVAGGPSSPRFPTSLAYRDRSPPSVQPETTPVILNTSHPFQLKEIAAAMLEGAMIGIIVSEIVLESENKLRQSIATGVGFVALQLPILKPPRPRSLSSRIGLVSGCILGLCGALGNAQNLMLSFFRNFNTPQSSADKSPEFDDSAVYDLRDWFSEDELSNPQRFWSLVRRSQMKKRRM